MDKRNFNVRLLSLSLLMSYCLGQQSISDINQLIRRPNPDSPLPINRQYPDTYFQEFLKKHGVNIKQLPAASNEEVSQVQLKKILTEGEFCNAFCNLNLMRNQTERLEKMENRMLSEIRKINLKLIRLEDNLKNLTNKIEDVIKMEMSTIKDEMIRSLKENLNRN